MYKYGDFRSEGTEFAVNVPNTPRSFDNFMWNDVCFANVQQTGVGCFDYQLDEREAVQLYTGIGRICDFDVFGREHLMNRLIYIRDNETGSYFTVNWECVKADYTFFSCVHGAGYTVITNETDGIRASFRIFVPQGKDAAELWDITLESADGRKRDISVFLYNQIQFKFKWGFDSYGDMIYRTVWLDKEQNAVIAKKHPFVKPHDFLTAYVAANRKIDAFDGTRDAFVGVYSTLKDPEAVVRGYCSNTEGSADATITALQFNLTLDGKAEKLEVIVGATDSDKRVKEFTKKYLGHFDTYFEELKQAKQKQLSQNLVCTPDRHFDSLANTWVKQATLFGAAWCRWGYNGYRDIVQQGLGVASIIPDRSRWIIVEALKRQYCSGLAVRGWNPIDDKAYSDSALWLCFTLIAYLRETGDFDLLDEVVPYFDQGEATVREHIDTALSFLEKNKGEDALLLIKFGDWNDSLTGTGKEGRGESVWLSIAYVEALHQMADLAGYLGEKERQEDYQNRASAMKKAINENAWDGKWYLRCIDDYRRPVGSHQNEAGSIFFEPQCWSLISGVAEGERAEQVIESCDEMLGTQLGYLLLSPVYREFDPNIGRISSMEPGIAENGTVYSHLNIWMILGLIRIGKADLAYQLFQKISPGYISDSEDPKNECPPFMYSNCYFGPDHKNNKYQMEFTWITGSVAWYNHVILNEILGAKADFGGLRIDPAVPSSWEYCSVKRTYRGCEYDIEIKNPEKKQRERLEITVDGQPVSENILPYFKDGKVHKVEVLIQ